MVIQGMPRSSAPFHRVEQGGLAGGVALGPGQAPAGRPPAVPVHDAGHVGGDGAAGEIGRRHRGAAPAPRCRQRPSASRSTLRTYRLARNGPCLPAHRSRPGRTAAVAPSLSPRPPGARPSPCPRWHALAIFAAGLAAGTVNVIVGSGSLITFPTLLALGYPPVLANVSNTVGLVPGQRERRGGLPAGAGRPAAAGWSSSARPRCSAAWSAPSCCWPCPTASSRRPCPCSSPWRRCSWPLQPRISAGLETRRGPAGPTAARP